MNCFNLTLSIRKMPTKAHIEACSPLYFRIFAASSRLEKSRAKKIISCCIQVDLFNKRLAEEEKILMSETIQKNFVIAKIKSQLEIKPGYLLIDIEKVFATETPVNAAKTTQKKRE